MNQVERYIICKNNFLNYINGGNTITDEDFNTIFNFVVTEKNNIDKKISLFIQGIMFDICKDVEFLNEEENIIMKKFENDMGYFKCRNQYFGIKYNSIWTISKIMANNDDNMAILALKVGVEEIPVSPSFFVSCVVSKLLLSFSTGKKDTFMYYSSDVTNYFYKIEKDKIIKIIFLEKEGYSDYYEDDLHMVLQIEDYKNFISLILGKFPKITPKPNFVNTFKTFDPKILIFRIKKIINKKIDRICQISFIEENLIRVKIQGHQENNFNLKKIDGCVYIDQPYDLSGLSLE